jgi:predicted pyridoxine 5'-phosphate oxidase superfamily flavin-nucleotide-binding protein
LEARQRRNLKKMANKFYDIAFTPSVKRAQEHYGSRRRFERIEDGRGEQTVALADAEIDFIERADGFYMATVGEQNQPYVQFRGGRSGFLKVLDEQTLGFADFRGNLQYISVGNLSANNRVALFLMDYANRQRLKIFAEAEVRDALEVPELITNLRDENYKAAIERAVVLHVKAFNWNCPQHITPRYTMEQIAEMIQPMRDHIEKLEKEIRDLKSENL